METPVNTLEGHFPAMVSNSPCMAEEGLKQKIMSCHELSISVAYDAFIALLYWPVRYGRGL